MNAGKIEVKGRLNKFFHVLSLIFMTVFKKSSQAKPPHVGMFAGSLLSYDTWSPTKGPQ